MVAAGAVFVLIFLDTTADPPPDAASEELDVSLRFLEAAAAAAAAASSSGKLMREKTLGLCFRSLAVLPVTAAAVTATALDSEVGGAWGSFLVDDSERR